MLTSQNSNCLCLDLLLLLSSSPIAIIVVVVSRCAIARHAVAIVIVIIACCHSCCRSLLPSSTSCPVAPLTSSSSVVTHCHCSHRIPSSPVAPSPLSSSPQHSRGRRHHCQLLCPQHRCHRVVIISRHAVPSRHRHQPSPAAVLSITFAAPADGWLLRSPPAQQHTN